MGTFDLPAQAGPDRDRAILAHLAAGDLDPIVWATVTSTAGGHSGSFYVMSDALKLGGVRLSVSATLEQQIADQLGCSLLTPKLADLIWSQRAATLLPTPRTITSSTAAMVTNSQAIDKQLAALGNPTGLLSTVGKHWVIANELLQHPGKAENYGWHFTGKFGGSAWASCVTFPNQTTCRVIQDPGWFHDPSHVDYSQTCVLVRNDCLVDGAATTLAAVLQDATLAPLASHQGALKVLRQPGVAPPSTGVVSHFVEAHPAIDWLLDGQDAPAAAHSTVAKTVRVAGFGVLAVAAVAYGAHRWRLRKSLRR